jgi:hypothetical protein
MSEKPESMADLPDESTSIEEEERKAALLYLKNMAQVFAIQYQIKAGIIQNACEYADNGTAEFFDLLMEG